MASVFTKIINKELPGHIVYESDIVIAILDIQPVQKGHVLIIPKEEVDSLFDVDHDTYHELWHVAKLIAHKIEQNFPCEKVGVSVIGLEVPHAHIHLMPINSLQDMNFNEKLSLTQEELIEIKQKIEIS